MGILQRHPQGASQEGWSIGCVGPLPKEPAAGERPPRALGSDVSPPILAWMIYGQGPCVIGSCSVGREGRHDTCHDVPYISLAMEKQLPRSGGSPTVLEVFLYLSVSLARLVDM